MDYPQVKQFTMCVKEDSAATAPVSTAMDIPAVYDAMLHRVLRTQGAAALFFRTPTHHRLIRMMVDGRKLNYYVDLSAVGSKGARSHKHKHKRTSLKRSIQKDRSGCLTDWCMCIDNRSGNGCPKTM